ncbi:MAG: transposase [Chitinophagales bacterium]|nr:transposase [Chitinophagales bacterium]
MYFFTATAKDWKNLFEDDEIKIILLQSMEWLVTNKKVQIHAFVIMPNHVHILWTHLDETYDIGASFKSFIASMIRKYLVKHNKLKLNLYISTQNDREYQFWKRRSKTIEMQNRIIAVQKVDYIHKNPFSHGACLTQQFCKFKCGLGSSPRDPKRGKNNKTDALFFRQNTLNL